MLNFMAPLSAYHHTQTLQEERSRQYHRLSLRGTSSKVKMGDPKYKDLQDLHNNSRVFSRVEMSKKGLVVVRLLSRLQLKTVFCTSRKEQFLVTRVKLVFSSCLNPRVTLKKIELACSLAHPVGNFTRFRIVQTVKRLVAQTHPPRMAQTRLHTATSQTNSRTTTMVRS
jgi:hypothetical protein